MDEGLGAVIGDDPRFSVLLWLDLPTKKCESLGIWEYGNIKLELQSRLAKNNSGGLMLVSDVVVTSPSFLVVMIPWCLFVVEPGGN